MIWRIRSGCGRCARRGVRCPMRAPTVAVGLAGRLRCASRSALARRNSLRSLRSLRSDSRRESEVGARAARVPSAPLPCSPPHKSPPPGIAHRAATLVMFVEEYLDASAKPWVGVRRQRHCAALRGAGLVDARAMRALRSSDSPRLFESSERSERSEFLGGPRVRAPEGIRSEAESAAHERRRTPTRGFASLGLSSAQDRSN
jgi:hypothetical protein